MQGAVSEFQKDSYYIFLPSSVLIHQEKPKYHFLHEQVCFSSQTQCIFNQTITSISNPSRHHFTGPKPYAATIPIQSLQLSIETNGLISVPCPGHTTNADKPQRPKDKTLN